MAIEVTEDQSLRNRALNLTREILDLVDGTLLSQPRHIVENLSTQNYDNPNIPLSRRQALLRGVATAAIEVAPPAAIGGLTLLVTKRPEIAAVAAGVTYTIEGLVEDYCANLAYWQSSGLGGDAVYDRWTYPLQRRLAAMSDYPDAAAPFWFTPSDRGR